MWHVEFKSFKKFKDSLKSMDITYDGDESIKFKDPQYGEVVIDGSLEGWHMNMTVDKVLVKENLNIIT